MAAAVRAHDKILVQEAVKMPAEHSVDVHVNTVQSSVLVGTCVCRLSPGQGEVHNITPSANPR